MPPVATWKARHLAVVERVPAQGARATVAALEPPIQAARMEQVLARAAPLARELLVAADDRVTNRAFGLTFHGTDDVASEGGQTVGEIAVGEGDDSTSIEQPAAPLLLANGYTVDPFDGCLAQRVVRWQADSYLHCLLIDFIGCDDFSRFLIHFDRKCFTRRRILRSRPFLHGSQGRVDDEWADLGSS